MSSGLRRRRWSLLLGGLVSAVLLYLAFRKVNIAGIRQALLTVSPGVLSLALLAKLLSLVLMGMRTQQLLRPLSRGRLGLWQASLAPLLGGTVNNLLPLRAGELYRLHHIGVHSGVAMPAVVVAFAFERLMDTLALALVLALGLGWAGSGAPAMPVTVTLAAACCLLAVAGVSLRSNGDLPRRLYARLEGWLPTRVRSFVEPRVGAFAQGVDALGSVPRVLLSLCLSIGVWGVSALGVQSWFWAFGLELPGHAPLVVLGFIAFGTALPSAPGFVGAYHYFVVLALTSVYHLQADVAGSVALVGHALSTLPWTLIGLPLLFAARRRPSLSARHDPASCASADPVAESPAGSPTRQ